MDKSLFKNIGQVALASVLLVVLQAYAFSEPGQAPPPAGGNVSAPINVGSLFQSKSGDLWVNSLGITSGLIVETGMVGFNLGTGNLPQSLFHMNGGTSAHPFRIDSEGNLNESIIEFRNLDTGILWEIGPHDLGAGLGNSTMAIHNTDGPGSFTFTAAGNLLITGKLTAPGGIDPPYVSYSDESHRSIRKYSKNVAEHEKVMQFWNGEKHRMEVYVIAEDKFYTIDGTLVED